MSTSTRHSTAGGGPLVFPFASLVGYGLAAGGMSVVMWLAYQWPLQWGLVLVGVSLVAHELGHKLIGRLAGIPHDHFAFSPLFAGIGLVTAAIGFPLAAMGGVVTRGQTTRTERFWMALGGPGVNLLLFGLFSLLHAVAPVTIQLVGHQVGLFEVWALLNLDLGAFNLAPVPGFDGWHLLQAHWTWYLGVFAVVVVVVAVEAHSLLAVLGPITAPNPLLFGLSFPATSARHARGLPRLLLAELTGRQPSVRGRS